MALRISEGTLEGRGLRIAIVASHFTPELTRRLVDGALRVVASAGVPDSALHLVNVPGAFELPMAAEELARQGTSDAIVCVGCVIRGETAHFDYVAGEAARGIDRVARSHHLPVTRWRRRSGWRRSIERSGRGDHRGRRGPGTAAESGADGRGEGSGREGGLPKSHIVVISGLPGSGKNTTARLLARRLPRAAHIEADALQ